MTERADCARITGLEVRKKRAERKPARALTGKG
jgi:hypothetical protein